MNISPNHSSGTFQSTRPSRASTSVPGFYTSLPQYFNPQGPRGPRLRFRVDSSIASTISIHKALAGLDLTIAHQEIGYLEFQSTRPSRASTRKHHFRSSKKCNFNPQGPRGPRRCPNWRPDTDKIFQSTRPSRASTLFSRRLTGLQGLFQSTRPSRASTKRFPFDSFCRIISIHKALAGLDPMSVAVVLMFVPISIHKALAGLDLN